MSIIVFTGPTLSATDAAHYLMADFRPPAKQGDVYQACLEQPKIIAIIDGYFESVPAVWHKEILYAMSQGIHVYGSSSIGALRAAELSYYGMQGVGDVYQQFNDGTLEDDDEVAIVHAPGELNYHAISEAMVNIRATLLAAHKAQIINQEQTSTLIALAKDTWYPKRSYEQLLTDANEQLTTQMLAPETHQALAAFIDEHAINVKRDDAVSMLQQLNNIQLSTLAAKTVDYAFMHTDAWLTLKKQVEMNQFAAQNQLKMTDLTLELKLSGRWNALKQQAQARQIALQKNQARQGDITGEQRQSALLQLAQQQQCINNGQIDFNQLTQWFESQQLDMPRFDQLIRKQSMLQWVDTIIDDIDEELVDILRLNNELGQIHQHITGKQRCLATTQAEITLTELGINESELWQWYFQVNLNSTPPKDVAAFAKHNGFSDVSQLQQAVLAEYHYVTQTQAQATQ